MHTRVTAQIDFRDCLAHCEERGIRHRVGRSRKSKHGSVMVVVGSGIEQRDFGTAETACAIEATITGSRPSEKFGTHSMIKAGIPSEEAA